MCGDDYFYEKCDETFQTIKMKNIIVNKYKKDFFPKIILLYS